MQPTQTTAPQASADPSQFGEYSDWAKQEMAKGFSADQLHATLGQQGGAAEPQPKGNWFSHLLPTLGSIAVPMAGAALAPVTGGTSLLVAAGLSGLGAAGGKAAENAIEGKGIGDDVGSAGAEGAIGGAAGGVVGKVLGKAAGGLANMAEKTGSEQAAKTAAQESIDTVANTYKDISPQLQKAYKLKDSVEHARAMGFDVSKPENLVNLGDAANYHLNNAVDEALTKSGPVDLAHYPQIIKDALAKEGSTLGSYEKIAASRGRFTQANTPAAKLLSQLEDLGAGTAKTASDPNELRTLTSKLGEMAADAKPTVTAATGAVDPGQRATYKVINHVRDQVKDALYNRPEVNDAIKKMTGNIVPDEATNITPELAEHLNGVISKAGTLGSRPGAQDLLDEISRHINVGNVGKEGQRVAQIATSTGGKARAAAEAGLGEAGGEANPVLDTASNFIAGPHTGIVTTAVKGAVHAAKNPAILSTLSRIGDMGAKLAPAAGAAVATSPNLAADPVSMPGGTMGATMQNQPMAMGGAQADPNSMASILAQYMHMGTVDPYLLGDTSGVVQALAPQVQKNEAASSVLGALPESYANAGGAQGTGGILSHITGLIPGTAAHTYQAQQNAAAQQLAQALGISPQAAAGLMPQLMQNGQSAGLSQGILGNLQGQLSYQ